MQNLQEIFDNYVIFENITRHLFKPAALIPHRNLGENASIGREFW